MTRRPYSGGWSPATVPLRPPRQWRGGPDFPPYPSALRLAGRRVVVVGGGNVAQRRVPALLASGRTSSCCLARGDAGDRGAGRRRRDHVGAARVTTAGDLDGAWYVIAATDDRAVNERVSAAAEERRIFCVRSRRRHAGDRVDPGGGPARRGHRGGGRQPRAAALGGAAGPDHRRGCATARSRCASTSRSRASCSSAAARATPTSSRSRRRRALADADVVVADRLAPRELLGELAPDVELVDVAKLPRGRSAAQEEINRVIVDRALAGQAGGAVQGRRQLRLRARVRGGARLRRGRRPVHRGARHHQRDLRARARRHPGDAPRGRPRVHRDLGAPAARPPGLAGRVGRASPGCAGPWCCSWRCRTCRPSPTALRRRAAGPRTTPVAVVADGSMPTQRTLWRTLGEVGADLPAERVRAAGDRRRRRRRGRGQPRPLPRQGA